MAEAAGLDDVLNVGLNGEFLGDREDIAHVKHNLSTHDPAAQKFGHLELASFAMGMGAFNLPGDFSLPSRSVCIAFFLQSALPQDTSSEAGDPIYRVLPKLAPAT
ncbi:MAG: linear amide C-N hydrolase [Chthoniobacterales bacterium]|nr:linear amide C-N hydrolase [Chthoniobacterales bacterium]